MQHTRERRVQRIRLAQPIRARLGQADVILVDVSLLGARIEHHLPLTGAAASRGRLGFHWDDEAIGIDCRVVRSRVERFSVGSDGLTVYHSGLEFVDPGVETKRQLKQMIARFISRALEEQKLNANGVIPLHDVAKMPIFAHGQLTADSKDGGTDNLTQLPMARMAKETGYICFQLDKNNWRKKRTQDPGQPAEGFTISALEDLDQADLLCDAYWRCDAQGRKMIRLFAELSIMDGEGIAPGRFDP